ncbi:MAG: gliding motility-associated ABC transporter permease subunit GldF [Prevotellaceae bacterium]|jgi:ABC-2 type transport system permease protein|nr:gliding motility-associated ABC transporter permease subunit GldF [Prevotellaceae bacterium]
MFFIFKKEVVSFFSSLTGYIAVGVFLLLCSWFLWLSPNDLNVLSAGYANIDGLFFIAPWLFLFLSPAITMRSFAEERKAGTMEMLLTHPLTEAQLITGKFLAAVTVVAISLLPALLYFYTVSNLGNPVGNIDSGATWGALIGLLLLAACYAAVGIFASLLTDSQLVAFLLAAAMCFFLYLGFDGLAALPYVKNINSAVANLGLSQHYKSISRGVVDARDMAYFAGVIVLFLSAARLKLRARAWGRRIRN